MIFHSLKHKFVAVVLFRPSSRSVITRWSLLINERTTRTDDSIIHTDTETREIGSFQKRRSAAAADAM